MPTLRYLKARNMKWRTRIAWTITALRADLSAGLERLAMKINSGPHACDCNYECDCPCYERGYDAEHGPYR